MSAIKVEIQTADGMADGHMFYPAGKGQFPAVLFYMDGLGIRPNLLSMGERLAENGYAVLMPNMFYRAGPPVPVDMAEVSREGPVRDRMMSLVQSLTADAVVSDTRAFLDFLDRDPKVKGPKYGCVGYCMGGSMTLRAAATFPDRIAAAASIHGGRLATDKPDSAHLLARDMRARIYVGVAGIDPWLFPGETEMLKQALEAAHLNYQVEEYPGATHGFAPPGNAVYDRAASEKHWERLLELFGATLR